jgi:hypothetical protein
MINFVSGFFFSLILAAEKKATSLNYRFSSFIRTGGIATRRAVGAAGPPKCAIIWIKDA